MNRIVRLSTWLLAAALITPLSAGECTHEAQYCLDYLVTMRNRGYAGIEDKLRGLGAVVERMPDPNGDE